MSMQGIDTILQHLANASGALERSSRPGIKEVKEAAGSAKIAADLLKASEVFLSNGIYVICDEPAGAYVDPAAHRIEMPEVREELVAEETPAALPPLPDLLGDFDQLHPEAQADRFSGELAALGEQDPEGSNNEEWDGAWIEAFNESRLDTYARLSFALDHRQPLSMAFPSDDEMRSWREQFAQPMPALPDDLVRFDTWDEADAADEFSRRLDALDDRQEEALRGQDANFAPWDAAWDQDRKDTFTRLLVAEARQDVSNVMLLPTDAERDEWLAQFAPVAVAGTIELVEEAAVLNEDTHQEEARFEAMLDQLEELGVEQSALKRKNWKKAHKAWHLLFAENSGAALATLEQVLADTVTTWEVPEERKVS